MQKKPVILCKIPVYFESLVIKLFPKYFPSLAIHLSIFVAICECCADKISWFIFEPVIHSFLPIFESWKMFRQKVLPINVDKQ